VLEEHVCFYVFLLLPTNCYRNTCVSRCFHRDCGNPGTSSRSGHTDYRPRLSEKVTFFDNWFSLPFYVCLRQNYIMIVHVYGKMNSINERPIQIRNNLENMSHG
jgi:hypothetical protein